MQEDNRAIQLHCNTEHCIGQIIELSGKAKIKLSDKFTFSSFC
jgi:hypothetical protein